jgi:hypothetical protein
MGSPVDLATVALIVGPITVTYSEEWHEQVAAMTAQVDAVLQARDRAKANEGDSTS